MLKLILILRKKLYPLIEKVSRKESIFSRIVLSIYWSIFWYAEEKLEYLELGTKGPKIRGSERSVLIEEMLRGLVAPKILEVGVGFGQNLAILCSMMPENKIDAIDINESRIESTKAYLLENGINGVGLEVANVLDLPYIDNSYDLVYASAMLLYLNNQDVENALREMIRVSKNRVALLEQHLDSVEEKVLDGEVTGGKYFLRDFNLIFKKIDTIRKVTECKIYNPRWGIESWKTAARVFIIEKNVGSGQLS